MNSSTRQPTIIEVDEYEDSQSYTITTSSSSSNTWDGRNENQNLHLSTGQPTITEACEHPVPHFQQQPKEESTTILSGSQRSYYTYTRPFPAYYFSVGCQKLNTSPGRPSERIDFSKPVEHGHQRVNIVLYGPVVWTNKLLKKFSMFMQKKHSPCRFEGPCSLSYQKDIVRGNILMSVFVWQTEDLEKSGCRIRDLYNTSNTTIVVVRKLKASPYWISCGDLVERIQSQVHVNIPIVVVVCRTDEYYRSRRREIRSAFMMHGYRLKAKSDLSAYLECTVDSERRVRNVFFTAIDVSQLKYLTM